MKDSLAAGLRFETTLNVSDAMLVPNVSADLVAFADMPPVFATAMMIGFIEATCIACLAPHLEDGEHTVGTHVNVSHIAATPVDKTVRAVVELIKVDGRMLSFQVQAFDENGLICEGQHQRAVILMDRFMDKINAM